VDKAKPFDIPKREVWEAFKKVKANQGAAGVDGQSIADFEADLSNNLYKLWNRMSSGSYMPPPVRRVDIPKGDSKTETRPLGIPTVADRIAQEVVKRYLEPILEPIFHEDSYGYRPGRSAIDAVRKARQLCWQYDWLLDVDVRSYLDASSHYTSRFFERSEEVRSDCRYLNSYAFCPSAIDVNSLELATLYTLQDRLPRDTE
jgi:RNA-directed DNA polymerase